jgi:short-subunit dehydrogenase
MGCCETVTASRLPPRKFFCSILNLVPSPSEALSSFSAVVITGGSSGIGKSFIELMGKLKPELVFCNLSRRAPAINSFPERLNHFAADLSRPADVERAAREVAEFLGSKVPVGRVLLINNSGFGTMAPFPEPNLAKQTEMIDLNVRAVVQLTGLLLPLLRARGGAIVNIASTAAFQPTPSMATYGATKAFVLHWSHALNDELRGTGVSALAVCPGTTRTEFFRTAGLKQGNRADALAMSSEAVVLESLRALGGGRSQVVTGWRNKLATFASSPVPKAFATRVAGLILRSYRKLQSDK